MNRSGIESILYEKSNFVKKHTIYFYFLEKGRSHEPPKRVLLKPKGWNICFTDFLFPGEGPEQSVKSAQELLDLEIDVEDVDNEFETFIGEYLGT